MTIAVNQFVDPQRRGTIIMGSYRCGSHFVERLCLDQCETMGLTACQHGEIKHIESRSQTLQAFINNLKQDDRYHVIIVNHLELKVDLSTMPSVDRWLLIRVVNDDKHRWYMSNFYNTHPNLDLAIKHSIPSQQSARYNGRPMIYQGNSGLGHYYDQQTRKYVISWERDRGEYLNPNLVDQTLETYSSGGHHATPEIVYETLFDLNTTDAEQSQDTADPINSLTWHMVNHMISLMIPVDLELRYQDLPSLANDRVRWRPNRYPDIDLYARSKQGPMINRIIDLWPDIPGVFKVKEQS